MFTATWLRRLMIISFLFTTSMSFARDYIIYSIAQDISMGVPNEKIKKNYYINMGLQQGLKTGTLVDVFRIISMNDPYEAKKRYDHKVKVGELKVLHSEQDTAITVFNNFEEGEEIPYFEIRNFMIGDRVNVKINQ